MCVHAKTVAPKRTRRSFRRRRRRNVCVIAWDAHSQLHGGGEPHVHANQERSKRGCRGAAPTALQRHGASHAVQRGPAHAQQQPAACAEHTARLPSCARRRLLRTLQRRTAPASVRASKVSAVEMEEGALVPERVPESTHARACAHRSPICHQSASSRRRRTRIFVVVNIRLHAFTALRNMKRGREQTCHRRMDHAR